MQIACHCIECQKLSATSFGISALLKKKHFTLESGSLSKFSRVADSGETNDCYFCQSCGNRIYHDNPRKPRVIRFKPGTLDDSDLINPDIHVWTQSKQKWIEIPDSVPQFATQPELGFKNASETVKLSKVLAKRIILGRKIGVKEEA